MIIKEMKEKLRIKQIVNTFMRIVFFFLDCVEAAFPTL